MPEPAIPVASTVRPHRFRPVLLIAAAVLAIALGGAVALTKPFQDGATGVFSQVVDGVKDHPRATLALCLGGVALVWLGIGAIIAGQELGGRGDASPRKRAGP